MPTLDLEASFPALTGQDENANPPRKPRKLKSVATFEQHEAALTQHLADDLAVSLADTLVYLRGFERTFEIQYGRPFFINWGFGWLQSKHADGTPKRLCRVHTIKHLLGDCAIATVRGLSTRHFASDIDYHGRKLPDDIAAFDALGDVEWLSERLNFTPGLLFRSSGSSNGIHRHGWIATDKLGGEVSATVARLIEQALGCNRKAIYHERFPLRTVGKGSHKWTVRDSGYLEPDDPAYGHNIETFPAIEKIRLPLGPGSYLLDDKLQPMHALKLPDGSVKRDLKASLDHIQAFVKANRVTLEEITVRGTQEWQSARQARLDDLSEANRNRPWISQGYRADFIGPLPAPLPVVMPVSPPVLEDVTASAMSPTSTVQQTVYPGAPVDRLNRLKPACSPASRSVSPQRQA